MSDWIGGPERAVVLLVQVVHHRNTVLLPLHLLPGEHVRVLGVRKNTSWRL